MEVGPVWRWVPCGRWVPYMKVESCVGVGLVWVPCGGGAYVGPV